jgi:REP element-mobilizing transposase RayT
MDRVLDAAATGPRYLQLPEIADMFVTALRAGDLEFHRYDLHAFVVMANHVHLLVTPRVVATQWLGPLKGFTAHAANKILGLHGKPFWQDESYDHLVRTGEEYRRIRSYIQRNPVKAGVVACASEFRWSSARTAA